MPKTNGERFADLQLHSSASDGSDQPSEVVRRAARKGFSAIALTDHDTMEGVPEAAAEAGSATLAAFAAAWDAERFDTLLQAPVS